MRCLSIAVIKADFAHATRNHGQHQLSVVQVLGCGQDARGGITLSNKLVLRHRHDLINTLRPQTHAGFKLELA